MMFAGQKVLSIQAISPDGTILLTGEAAASHEWFQTELSRMGHGGTVVRLVPVTDRGPQPDVARSLKIPRFDDGAPAPAPELGDRDAVDRIEAYARESAEARIIAARAEAEARNTAELSRLTAELRRAEQEAAYWQERAEAIEAKARNEREGLTERIEERLRLQHEREVSRLRRELEGQIDDLQARLRRVEERAARDIEDEAARGRRRLEEEEARRKMDAERAAAELAEAKAKVAAATAQADEAADKVRRLTLELERRKLRDTAGAANPAIADIQGALGVLSQVPSEHQETAIRLLSQRLGVDLDGSIFDRIIERGAPMLIELLSSLAKPTVEPAKSLPTQPKTSSPATEEL